ncbi:2-hydroxyacid dehydrogenase [Frigoriflavimonas asaccharolytica]|uniref:Glyoxylate/hydroxypyruvate reductase B n=1 Tax=Frigoriflavimonas asaccharolytica TaxID=2735899 RepID=A0A8J8G6J1_9FLAO|nr:D-glycerate dehydrogenase [Frigoriflavimonas asaccharolytica]NRS91625.1 lactate dehydrogenase-like 2-hydroxyacid dehydrogenase [Frigoriflavimonas asaccharolytica]
MKVFINSRIPAIALELLTQENIEYFLPENKEQTHKQWLENCKKADVLLNVGRKKLDKTFFENCPNVKAIVQFAAGYDNIDMEIANARKIPVGNTPHVLSRATSDVAFLLMQMVSRRASYNINKVQSGNWKDFDALEQLGQELYGKTLGVYGLGKIGFEMAEKCKKAFDMDIIYHNRTQNIEAETKLDAKYVSFEDLAKNADVLSIHANFSAEQNEIFNASVFEKMKSNSIFINTARGSFHNQVDLLEFLKNGKIWGAGLDVTNPEPIDMNNEILQLPNVCVLPHIGSATVEARNGMAKIVAANIIAFSKGEQLPYCVNPEIYENFNI